MEVVEYTVQISALPDSDKCASQRSYKRYPMQISAQANAAINVWFAHISIPSIFYCGYTVFLSCALMLLLYEINGFHSSAIIGCICRFLISHDI